MAEMREQFTSRWGLILAAIGMAVGTGNVWRFPRIFATNEGGTFLIPWLIFLFIWSIPLLILEMGMGKKTRKGLVGTFSELIGERFAWMGGFVAVVTTMIMFYYSVVAGWCLRYFISALTGGLKNMIDPVVAQQAFESFATSGWALPFHMLAIGTCALIVYRGVVGGIERANRILIPILAIMLVIAALRALTLPGAHKGLQFMFHIDWSTLGDYRIWLEGLTQSAWSTGAGWGLLLTYAVYTRDKEDTVTNCLVVGLGNNSMSLLAALAVIPTVFASFPTFQEAFDVATFSGPAATGLTFVWIPILFGKLPFGQFFSAVFFLALSAAALSSLIAMVELATRILIDFGIHRQKAIKMVFAAGLLGGVPSALSLSFFVNQDWVWGLGLMVSGGIFAFAALRYGLGRVRSELVNLPGNEIHLGGWFNGLIGVLVPAEFTVLILWWAIRSFGWVEKWWNPFSSESLGTCLFQWTIVIIVLIALNNRMAARVRTVGDMPALQEGGA
ncbi:sodium-dependent transporter [Gemmatimonadota bacterium]